MRALTSWSAHFAKQQAADLPVSCWNRNQWQILESLICTQTTKCQTNISKQFLFPGIPVQYLCPVLRSQHTSRKDSEIKTQKDFLLLTEFQNESLQSWIIPNELSAQHTSQNRTFTRTHKVKEWEKLVAGNLGSPNTLGNIHQTGYICFVVYKTHTKHWMLAHTQVLTSI